MLPKPKRATWADLVALPEHLTGELIAGELHVQPRPRSRHGRAALRIGGLVQGRFEFRDEGGPGGWWIVIEPGIELKALDIEEIVPDIGGWTREPLPELPDRFTTAPDWVCEVLSPSTRRHDLRTKRPLYAAAGVAYMWIVDIDAKTLTASKNQDGKWLELGVWSDDDVVSVEPFVELPLKLSELW